MLRVSEENSLTIVTPTHNCEKKKRWDQLAPRQWGGKFDVSGKKGEQTNSQGKGLKIEVVFFSEKKGERIESSHTKRKRERFKLRRMALTKI